MESNVADKNKKYVISSSLESIYCKKWVYITVAHTIKGLE